MNELVYLNRTRSDSFTTSEIIAENAHVQHHTVTRLIQQHESDLKEFGILRFNIEEIRGRGQPVKSYRINEQQATLLISYLKNTAPVRAFKKELVRQFFAMREFIEECRSSIWADARALGKYVRREETDAIKLLVDYARMQGSQNAERYYINLSKLADRVAGIEDRDNATVMQLTDLRAVERIITLQIRMGIGSGVYYRDIYAQCRDRLSQFCVVSGLIEKGA